MNYKCYGDGNVKQPPEITIVYDTVVEDDPVCIYRGLCVMCMTRPASEWVETPAPTAQSRYTHPRPTIEQQAAMYVSPYISVSRADTGEYIISHYQIPGDSNTPIVETRFNAC